MSRLVGILAVSFLVLTTVAMVVSAVGKLVGVNSEVSSQPLPSVMVAPSATETPVVTVTINPKVTVIVTPVPTVMPVSPTSIQNTPQPTAFVTNFRQREGGDD